MLSRGSAKKVVIYVNEDTRHHGDALWSAIVHFLKAKQVAGATVLRPVAGFGAHEILHSPDQEVRAEHMPLRIEFIDTAAKVDEVLPTLYEMVEDGLIEVQETSIVKAAMKGRPAPAAPHAEMKGPAKHIRIYLGEDDKADGEPLFDAIVKRLLMMEVAGATVYRGILGYGARRHTHREKKLFRISPDAPVVISVVERPERTEEILSAVEPMIQNGLIVISDVEAHRFVHALPEEGAPDAPATAG
ncbi:MAG TPA: DUF190 domain-containing protein [Bryobacteraceae bacterium]|nr:DUF190 domain-containing protein [Bryobacteraceae bacterium]